MKIVTALKVLARLAAPEDFARLTAPAAHPLIAAYLAQREDLARFCRARLAGYKVPREIRVHVELPRSATGKILKRALYESYK